MFITVGLSYIIYDLTRNKYDEEGNIIEDEYSDLPLYERVYKRLQREFNYYTKVADSS